MPMSTDEKDLGQFYEDIKWDNWVASNRLEGIDVLKIEGEIPEGCFKVLVAGPREGVSYPEVKEHLDMLYTSDQLGDRFNLVIIEGTAKGVDTFAKDWAIENNVRYKPCPADWEDLSAEPCVIKVNRAGYKYNALAGHNRNRTMGTLCDKAVILWNGTSTGTKNMLDFVSKKDKEGKHKLLYLWNKSTGLKIEKGIRGTN